MEKRHNYLRRVAEVAVQQFITNEKINVTGLVLAGSADFKKELSQSDLLDQRLATKILSVVDVSYGGENGFNQAVELTTETLAGVKFVREKRIVGKFFEEIAMDTRKYCYGVADTMRALEMGAVEKLLMYEDLEDRRIVFINPNTGEEKVRLLSNVEAMN